MKNLNKNAVEITFSEIQNIFIHMCESPSNSRTTILGSFLPQIVTDSSNPPLIENKETHNNEIIPTRQEDNTYDYSTGIQFDDYKTSEKSITKLSSNSKSKKISKSNKNSDKKVLKRYLSRFKLRLTKPFNYNLMLYFVTS